MICEKYNLIYHATFIMLYSENWYGKNHFFSDCKTCYPRVLLCLLNCISSLLV